MAVDNVQLRFDNQFVGELTSPKGTVKIGAQDGGMAPYHLLFGALGSCFYSTFLSIANKRKQTFDDAFIEISGTKRTTEIPTLESVLIRLVIKNPSDQASLRKCAELGTRFCSIHETISKVAEMHLEVEFL